jgi:hypothetical protein
VGGLLTASGGLTSPADATLRSLAVTGLTGAATPSRYVGGTATGPPTTGTFTVGDFVVTADGAVWVCVTAGSPGTWKPVSPRTGRYSWLVAATSVNANQYFHGGTPPTTEWAGGAIAGGNQTNLTVTKRCRVDLFGGWNTGISTSPGGFLTWTPAAGPSVILDVPAASTGGGTWTVNANFSQLCDAGDKIGLQVRQGTATGTISGGFWATYTDVNGVNFG